VALDELPALKVWALRTAGLIAPGTRRVMIEAGGSLRTVAVEETPMKNGGVHAFTVLAFSTRKSLEKSPNARQKGSSCLREANLGWQTFFGGFFN
jgi:hypothetical protein